MTRATAEFLLGPFKSFEPIGMVRTKESLDITGIKLIKIFKHGGINRYEQIKEPKTGPKYSVFYGVK